MEINYNGYPVFKGLQKPLEFMGIRGRFLIYIGGAIGIGFLGFLLFAFLFGQLVGFIFLVIVVLGGYVASFFLQRKGLHSKKKNKEVFIITTLYSK